MHAAQSQDLMELELPASAESVMIARRLAGEFASRVGARSDDVELAVSEAVTNAVLHAYPERSDGTITVSAELRGSQLLVTVIDDGTGVRPNIHGSGLGVGIPIIARVSDEYRLEDDPAGGAMVTMLFSAGGG